LGKRETGQRGISFLAVKFFLTGSDQHVSKLTDLWIICHPHILERTWK